MLDEFNVDELKIFIQCIVYCNTTFNIDSGNPDAQEECLHISDTTILADLTVSPKLLFLAQYYDLERNLYGGPRIIEPYLFLVYNFNSKSWIIIKNELSGFQPIHMNELINQFNHDLLVDNVQHTKNQLMDCISKI
ncbi:unnamed protein product [Adineta steineri]|uniref:Uncharacterized protein n=1 Tax=Adineta steineri TaxID=433720 RepID=A0A819VNW9_9BILA|nr:unnamed protein product [Adineta steineri]CAF4110816.1 unnamed protein product [Adineta steineri]